MPDVRERIEQLTQQGEQAKALWLKCLGGIETLEQLDREEKEDKKPKKELAEDVKK